MTADYEGIIVLGVPRSGTTLIRRLLDAHPRICCPPETNLLSAASRFLEEHRLSGGLSVGVVPGLDFSGVGADEVLGRLREFIFEFFRGIARRAGKQRWAEKTAVDIFHLDAIERLCGARCRYLFIARDPLDAIASMKELADKTGAYLPELHVYIQRHPSPLVAFAHAWRDANLRALRFVERHPDNSLLVRYEDLVSRPDEILRQVFAFLDEPTDVAELLRVAFGRKESVGLGDWKTYETGAVERSHVGRGASLGSWTAREVMPIVGDVMTRIGYEPLHVAGEGTDDAQRRDELSRMVAGLKMAGPGASRKP